MRRDDELLSNSVACAVFWPAAAAAHRFAFVLPALLCTMALCADAAEIHAEVRINAQTQATTVTDPMGYVQEHLVAEGAVGDAIVGLGWMRLNFFMAGTVIQLTPDEVIIKGGGTTTGRWTDELTITPANPSVLGQPGTATFAVHLDGFIAASGTAGSTVSDARARVRVEQDGFIIQDIFDRQAEFPPTSGENFDETIEFTLDVVFGQPFDLSLQLQASAEVDFDLGMADVGDSGFGEADLSDTLLWMGTVRIADGLGNEVADYTLTSASGTDYRSTIQPPPVPEPTGAGLVLLALISLVAFRRRLGVSAA